MFDTLVSVSFGEDDGVRVIENMLEATRQLAQQDLAALDSAACKRQTVLVAQLLSALEVVQGDQLVELDRRGVTDAEDGHKTANWLAHVTQTPKSAAKRRLNVATCLNQNFGLVRQSILNGKLSWDHGAALQRATNNRNVDRLTRVQDVLIDISKDCTSYDTWAQQISYYGKLADEDGPSTHQQMCENNYLRFFNEFNGSYRVDGRLSNEYVEIVKQAIDRESQSLFNKYAADREVDDSINVPPLPTLQALALVDIVRRSNGAPNAPFRPLADITLVVNANELVNTDNTTATTVTGAGSKITADMLACDPVFHPIVINSLGTPLAAGRSTRLATSAQRRALIVRDGGCVFPGCTATHQYCEAHHVIHYRNGGKTDLNNLAFLCHHHHSVTHRNSWHMQAVDDDGNFKWTTPTGRQISSQRHGRKPTQPPTKDDQNTA